MSQRWILVLCFLLSILMVGCSLTPGASVPSGSASSASSSSPPATNLCNSRLEYEGTITTIGGSSHGKGFTLLVHGKLGKALQQDQFVAHLDQQQTKIYDDRQSPCRSASLSVLQNGQQIRVQSTGIVVTTYPGQIDAVEVIILS